MPLLKVVRDSGYADRARAYKVVVDGQTVGEIRNGETREFPITSGQHDVSLKIDWCGSKIISFIATEGDVFTFDAKSNLRGRRLLMSPWYALFAWNSWLVLEMRSEAQPTSR